MVVVSARYSFRKKLSAPMPMISKRVLLNSRYGASSKAANAVSRRSGVSAWM